LLLQAYECGIPKVQFNITTTKCLYSDRGV
jgi:hypothetical protein